MAQSFLTEHHARMLRWPKLRRANQNARLFPREPERRIDPTVPEEVRQHRLYFGPAQLGGVRVNARYALTALLRDDVRPAVQLPQNVRVVV